MHAIYIDYICIILFGIYEAFMFIAAICVQHSCSLPTSLFLSDKFSIPTSVRYKKVPGFLHKIDIDLYPPLPQPHVCV